MAKPRLTPALALLNNAPLTSKEAGFVAQMGLGDQPMTQKQARWFGMLLERHGFSHLSTVGEA